MSKLYNKYQFLKTTNTSTNTLYLFKSGIFFILLDQDAKIAANLFNLKLTNLNENVSKCGFPISSFDKYLKLISTTGYQFKVVDVNKDAVIETREYIINDNIKKVVDEILNLSIDNLSISEAYDFLYKIQKDLNSVIKE